jgi:hypothetical protein
MTLIQKALYMRKWRLRHPGYNAEQQSKFNKAHPSFINWHRMMDRCTNPSNNRYSRYGAKNIRVYKPWSNFKIYEKEFGYTKPGLKYTVDRIDNKKGYFPGNIRWTTKYEQTQTRASPSKALKEFYASR